jgi:hypothetical protein
MLTISLMQQRNRLLFAVVFINRSDDAKFIRSRDECPTPTQHVMQDREPKDKRDQEKTTKTANAVSRAGAAAV